MYLAIGFVLGVVWLLGMMSGYTLGGAIYAFLVGAAIMTVLGLREWWRRPA